MAKMNITVDNEIDKVKLVSNEKMEKKNKKSVIKNKKNDNKEKKQKKQSYISQVMREMKQVTWPTKKNLLKYSIATILMIILLSLFFIGVSALFDLLYALVQGWIG